MCERCVTRNVVLLGPAYDAVRAVFGPHHVAGGESVVWILGDRVIKLTVMTLGAYRKMRTVLRLDLPLVLPTEVRVVAALPGGRVAVYVAQPRVTVFRGRARGAKPQAVHQLGGDVFRFGDGHWKNFDSAGRLLDFGKLKVSPDRRARRAA